MHEAGMFANLLARECLLCMELECLPLQWDGNVCCARSWNVYQFIGMGMFAVRTELECLPVY